MKPKLNRAKERLMNYLLLWWIQYQKVIVNAILDRHIYIKDMEYEPHNQISAKIKMYHFVASFRIVANFV